MSIYPSILNLINNSIATVGSQDAGVKHLCSFTEKLNEDMTDVEIYSTWVEFQNRPCPSVTPLEFWAQVAMSRLMLHKLPEDLREAVNGDYER